jgi:hypothetical protein
MQDFIVFGKFGQFIVTAETWVRAVQVVVSQTNAYARDCYAHDLSGYNEKLRKRLLRESKRLA